MPIDSPFDTLVGIRSPFGDRRAAPADTTAPVINTFTYDDATQTLSLDITETSGSVTVFWASVANPNTPMKSDIENDTGTALDTGSFAATDGSNSVSITLTDTAADEIHVFARDGSGNESAISIETGVVVMATATNLATDPDFDDPSLYTVDAGISVTGSEITVDGTNAANARLVVDASSVGAFTAIPSDASTYESTFTVSRVGVIGDAISIEMFGWDGPSGSGTYLGDSNPTGTGSTSIGTVGQKVVQQFTFPAGTTHVSFRLTLKDDNMDFAFGNWKLTEV